MLGLFAGLVFFDMNFMFIYIVITESYFFTWISNHIGQHFPHKEKSIRRCHRILFLLGHIKFVWFYVGTSRYLFVSGTVASITIVAISMAVCIYIPVDRDDKIPYRTFRYGVCYLTLCVIPIRPSHEVFVHGSHKTALSHTHRSRPHGMHHYNMYRIL